MADNSTGDIYLRTEPKYFPLLNTYVRDFHYKGKVYKTAEHLFQALKFLDRDKGIAETIRQCNNPLTEATKNLDKRRADWYVINKDVLKIALYYKFTEHEDLKKLLMGTGSRGLKNNVMDRFWGTGEDHNASNQFGVILMELRKDFAKPKTPDLPILPQEPRQIRFYNKGEPYYDFTNFAEVSVPFDGKVWSTSEHLFQAWKFPGDTEHLSNIQKSTEPSEALNLGRQGNLRDDWDAIKIDVMTYVVYLKFTNSDKKKILIDTGGAEIIENTETDKPSDVFWGCGTSGTGRNELGKALMRVRDIILYGFPPPSLPPRPPYFKLTKKADKNRSWPRRRLGGNNPGPSRSK